MIPRNSHVALAGALAVFGSVTLTVRPPVQRGALAPGVTAITNVAVIPMHVETVLRDATVIVRDGRIEAVGPAASTPVPAGARVIDARRKFLIGVGS